MASWPVSSCPFPKAVFLGHEKSDGGSSFDLYEVTLWPNLNIPSQLPLHVVKVCAVAFHRDELRFTAEEMNNPDVRFKSVGYEFSGIVVSAAPNSPLQLGMEVYGRTDFRRQGNSMTYTAAKFHELARKPKSISWEAAASIPIGGSVAYQALFDYPLLDHPSSNDWGRRALALGLNRGKRILITAAGTPAGLWAVQLAKLAGVSKIVATCAAADIMAVLDMGADEACNWTNEGSLANWDGEPFDIVVDFMGGLTLTLAWGLVKENGKILSTTDEDMLDAMPDVVKPGIQHFPFLLEHTPKYLNVISSLLDRDIATWWLEHSDVFDIAQHEMACARLASSSRGQVVLALDDGTPQSLIAQLEKHQEEWRDLRPFNQYTMEAARLEARPERFEFCRWLRNVGSNNLDEVLRGSPEPMMPPPRPPPPPTPRSRQLPLVKSVSWSSGSESSSSDGSGGATNFKKMVEEQEREKGGRRPPSLGCQFPAWVKPDGTEKHGMEA